MLKQEDPPPGTQSPIGNQVPKLTAEDSFKACFRSELGAPVIELETSKSFSVWQNTRHIIHCSVSRALPQLVVLAVFLASYYAYQSTGISVFSAAEVFLSVSGVIIFPMLHLLHSRDRYFHLKALSVIFMNGPILLGSALVLEKLLPGLGTNLVQTLCFFVIPFVIAQSFQLAMLLRLIKTPVFLAIEMLVVLGITAAVSQQLCFWYFILTQYFRNDALLEFLFTGVFYPAISALTGKIMVVEITVAIFMAHFPGLSRKSVTRGLVSVAEIALFFPCLLAVIMLESDRSFFLSLVTTFCSELGGFVAGVHILRSKRWKDLKERLLADSRSFGTREGKVVPVDAGSNQEAHTIRETRLVRGLTHQISAVTGTSGEAARLAFLYSELACTERFITLAAPLVLLLLSHTDVTEDSDFSIASWGVRAASFVVLSVLLDFAKRFFLWKVRGIDLTVVHVTHAGPLFLMAAASTILTVLSVYRVARYLHDMLSP